MNNPIDLPSKINKIDVYSGQVECTDLWLHTPLSPDSGKSTCLTDHDKKRHGRLFIGFSPPDILSKLA